MTYGDRPVGQDGVQGLSALAVFFFERSGKLAHLLAETNRSWVSPELEQLQG